MPGERPIIMRAESVRAILSGTKTQTRRVIKPQPNADEPGFDRSIWSGGHQRVTLGCSLRGARRPPLGAGDVEAERTRTGLHRNAGYLRCGVLCSGAG